MTTEYPELEVNFHPRDPFVRCPNCASSGVSKRLAYSELYELVTCGSCKRAYWKTR